MKRSFILLLVVALLATMIPSFALAETATATEAKTEPTIKFTEEEVKNELERPDSEENHSYLSVTYEVSGIKEAAYAKIASNNTAVVSISYKGAQKVENDGTIWGGLYCKSEGEAEITATLYADEDCTKVLATSAKPLKVTVTKKPIEKITFEEEEYEVTVDYYAYVWASVSPDTSYYAEDDLIWSVGDESIAVVDARGNLRGVKAGETTVTATAPDTGKATKSAKVVVKEAKEEEEDETAAPTLAFTAKKVTADSSYFDVGRYLQVKDYNYNDRIVWVSSDKSIAWIEDSYDGEDFHTCHLEFSKSGTVTITAFSKLFPAQKATIEVTYVEKAPESLTFANLPTEMKAGDSIRLRDYATTKPEYYDLGKFTWTSTDAQVAYVDGGYLYAEKPGQVTITASYDGKEMAKFDITVKDEPVTGVKFAKKEYTVLVGDRFNLTENQDFTIEPKNHGTAYSKIWTSSDENVASVDTDGEVHGNKPGTATITLTIQNADGTTYSDDITVTVKGSALESVAFAEESLNVTYSEKGGAANQTNIDLVIKPATAKVTATWQTSDPDVAYVIDRKNNGSYPVLVATGYGECDITVTVTDGTTTKTATLKVKVEKPKTSVKLVLDQTKVNGYIVKGDKNAILLKATDKNTGDTVPVTWTTSNKKVATVSKKGVVRFIAPGKAVITATTTDGKQTATCAIKVRKAKVTKIVRSEKVITVKVGEKAKLGVTVKPVKAYDSSLSFESSDPKTVVVSKKGVVKGLKTGKAVITITAKDGSGVQTRIAVKVVANGVHNADELIDDTAEELTIDGDLAVDLGDFEDLIIDDLGDDIDGVTEVTIE